AELRERDAVALELGATPLRSLGQRQIEEPRAELELRASIPALTGVSNPTSLAVQHQYEANPYPRWMRVRQEAAERSVAACIRGRFPHVRLDGEEKGPACILIAGSGTGRHPISTALRFPDASVLAVDLSLTSLAYALRRTRELG